MRGLNLKSPKGRPFANGGPVRGPGTGTSDEVPDEVPNGTYIMPTDSTQAIGEQNLESMGAPVARGLPMRNGAKVPVQLSNGEFKLPPEQVHAVGVQALDQMKDATHTPTARGLPGFQMKAKPEAVAHTPTARGFAPANVHARVQREEPRQFFASGGVARGLPLRLAEGGLATKSPSGLYMDDRAQELKTQLGQGSYAQAAGTAARTAVQGLGMYGIEAADKLTSPVVSAARGFGAGLVGSDAHAGTPPATTPAVPKPPATSAAPNASPPAAPAANPTDTRLANGTQLSPGSPSSPPAPGATAAAPAPSQAMPGVYRNGNSYSDTPDGAAVMTQPRGMPSAQNLAAADALAARGMPLNPPTATADYGSARGLAGIDTPTVRHSGNDWAARNALRSAEVSASSITNRDLGRNRSTPALDAYRSALASDTALQQAEPAMAQATMRENAGLQRETMRQDGETQRTGMRTSVDQQRVGVDARRVATDERRAASEVSARGLDIRAGQRQQDLQERYAAAKTPEERAAIAQQVRDLSGRPHESPYKLHVTPTTKNADSSTTMGSVYRINTQTGDVQEVGASKVQDIATDQRAIAIRDNKSMTREQKAAALQNLGYGNT